MPTYKQANFDQIATAIGMEARHIAKHGNLFEAAAVWYRLNRRGPTRVAPSNLRRKLDQIAKSARRLLKSLGVNAPDEAADGPGDAEILTALVLVGEPNADPVIKATRRIGRLVEVSDGVAAAAEFDRRAKKAAVVVADVGKLTVREGNPGDDAVNDWIAAMMGLYRMIPAKSPQPRLGLPSAPTWGLQGAPSFVSSRRRASL